MSETTPLKQTDAPIAAPNYKKVSIVLTIMTTVGFSIAYSCMGSSDLLESKMQTIQSMELHWLYLALVVLGKAIFFINFAPMGYKNGLKGNLRSNPFFYEVVAADGETKDDQLIAYKNDGPLGMYNRSNRSVQHMVEGSGAFFAALGPVGFLFPKQTLYAVSAFSFGRILHQKLYANGYGPHAVGFMFSMMSIQTIEGLALITFLKAQGYM